jgi:hypothetical protein
MDVPGNKCVRCGRITRPSQSLALPICCTCAAELKRAREQPRSCPIDGNTLSKEIVLNVVIDHCPRCGGVWLDAGELRLLIEGRTLQGFLDGFADSLDVS